MVAFDRGKNVGWKMVYNFLGRDEKTDRNLLTFDQNIRSVYSNIRAVYPNKNHVTTHPGNALYCYCGECSGSVGDC